MRKKNTDISERVSQVINYFNVTKNDFAKNLGYTRSQSVYDIVNGKSKPSFDFFNRLYNTDYSETINSEWLLTGKGKMLKQSSNIINQERLQVGCGKLVHSKSFTNIIKINPQAKANTVIADVKALTGFNDLISNPKKLEELPAISLPNAPNGLNIAFQIEGDSMHPTVRHLDFVAANQLYDAIEIKEGYTYIIVDKDDGVLCKRLYKEGSKYKLVSDNLSYPPYLRSRSDIKVFFRCFMRLSTDFRAYFNDVRGAIKDLRLEVQQIKSKMNA
ncbi:MAG: S24 family peptidase [Tenacibaculum sp.]